MGSIHKKKKCNENLDFWLLWEVRSNMGSHMGTEGWSFLLLTTGLVSPVPSYSWLPAGPDLRF